MCGIVGSVNWGDTKTLDRMNEVQRHRGPDDQGLWEHHYPNGDYVGLGSRRLAILDLSPAGHMPMCNEDQTVWIAFNGEIYNFPELRQELISKGHTFRSNTDTEVIVHLYEEEGIDCARRLNGMFAFCICDLRQGSRSPRLFLARDHFGVKPLYYIHQGSRFAFASEVKSLTCLPGFCAEVDLEALDQYLTFLWVPDPLTMFRGVLKIPAGHYALFENGHLEISQYWDLSFPPAGFSYASTEADLVEELRERFKKSVQGQMISDVPLGAFLSAGLDSTSIVAAMAGSTDRPVRTYTISFPAKYRVGESTIDDPDVAARVAKNFNCTHREIVVEPQVADLLPHLIWHM
ncbi:MAG: asparagine synthase (glutamine-hydrolyzing), partial [Armatimonadota bacterium]|nr:asparagine synthase (glutamine-hydrolyzing) [Armatimonadota bacterium]